MIMIMIMKINKNKQPEASNEAAASAKPDHSMISPRKFAPDTCVCVCVCVCVYLSLALSMCVCTWTCAGVRACVRLQGRVHLHVCVVVAHVLARARETL